MMVTPDHLRRQAPGSAQGRTRQRTWLEVLAALTGILAFATAALGYVSARATGEATDLSRTVSDLQARVEADQTLIDGLEAENAELAAQVQALQGQLPPGAPVPTPGTAAIRHQGQVDIGDDSLDLNAPASDPKWGMGETHVGEDIVRHQGGGLFIEADYLNLPPGTKADYPTCSSATGYQYGGNMFWEPTELERDNLCLRLNSGRYATLKVVGSANDLVTVDLTTWEKI